MRLLSKTWRAPAASSFERTNRRLLEGSPSPLELNARRLAEVMRGYQLLPGVLQVSGLADPSHLPTD